MTIQSRLATHTHYILSLLLVILHTTTYYTLKQQVYTLPVAAYLDNCFTTSG